MGAQFKTTFVSIPKKEWIEEDEDEEEDKSKQ